MLGGKGNGWFLAKQRPGNVGAWEGRSPLPLASGTARLALQSFFHQSRHFRSLGSVLCGLCPWKANSLGIWAFTLTLLFSGCPVVSTQRRSPPAEMVLQAPPVQIFWLSPLSGEADSGGRERGKGERTGQGVRQYRPVGRRQEEMLHKSCKEEKSPCRVRVRAHSLMGNHRIIS